LLNDDDDDPSLTSGCEEEVGDVVENVSSSPETVVVVENGDDDDGDAEELVNCFVRKRFNLSFQLFGGPCLVVVVVPRELSIISPFMDDVTDGDFICMRLSSSSSSLLSSSLSISSHHDSSPLKLSCSGKVDDDIGRR
jgi:hypothetical protein